MTATKRALPGPEFAPYWQGNLMEWCDRGTARDRQTAENRWAVPDEWRDNQPFRAALTLTGIERGRSAARFMWYDPATSARYPMFLIDAAQLMMDREGVAGAVADRWWIIVKRGQNYGIMPLAAEHHPDRKDTA